MKLKSSLALSAAVLMTASAFAADTIPSSSTSTPDKLLPAGSGSAITQPQDVNASVNAQANTQVNAQTDAKDAATSTSASQETTTTTTTGNAVGDTKTTETTQVKETEAKSAPAVDSSTTAATQTSTSATSPAQSNNVQKLFHMLQHSNQPQSGATSPEAQPGSSAKTAQ